MHQRNNLELGVILSILLIVSLVAIVRISFVDDSPSIEPDTSNVDILSKSPIGKASIPSSSDAYSKFSANVYRVDPIITPALSLVQLRNLDGSGYLRGNYVEVIGSRVYSANNIFVYSPINYGSSGYNPQGQGFDATMAYYSANEAANYFRSLGFSARKVIVGINSNNCQTCPEPWLGYYGGGKISVPISVKGKPIYYRDIKGIFHEYTHFVYTSMVSNPMEVENEGYAIYFPSSYSNTPRYSEYLNPSSPKNLEDNSFYGENNPFAFAAALWAVRSALGQTLTDRLIYYSWKLQQTPSGNYRRLPNGAEDGFVSLIEADWQLYKGQHVSVIKEKFKNRGIICETCVQR